MTDPVSNRIDWLLRRLVAMSPTEVGHRLVFATRKALWSRRTRWTEVRPAEIPSPTPVPSPPPSDAPGVTELLAEADAMLAGHYPLMGLTIQEKPLDWHRDPLSGVTASLTFGPELQYRDPSVAGEARNLWEKGRQHYVTVLATAFWLTGDERYSDAAADLVRSWLDGNPFPRGIAWASSLEAGIRLIGWVWADRLLAGSAAHGFLFGPDGALWAPIHRHQWYIARHFAHGSSANNHLIGEAAGLYVAATAWPSFPDSPSWRDSSRAHLERQITRQTFPSGLNREQAFAYHLFALEFLVLAGIEGERAGHPFSAGYTERLRAMTAAVDDLTDTAGGLPRYGDSDDGRVLRLERSTAPSADWLRRVGHAWLGVPPSGAPPRSGLIASHALGFQGPRSESATNRPRVTAFDDAGVYLLRNNDDGLGEVLCVCDAGPLGFLSIAAHGHADALSFTLTVAGQPVLVDPGTYVYHGDAHWRSYFRGTGAHNTITVMGRDQSVSGGPFIWTAKANTTVTRWSPEDSGGLLEAEHDGYRRLPSRVTHRRSIELRGRRLRVDDTLVGAGHAECDFRLHVHPDVDARLDGHTLLLRWVGGHADVGLDPTPDWRLIRAADDGGWYSPAFNVKVPSTTLTGSFGGPLPLALTTTIDVSPASLPDAGGAS